ncbi:MAG TPA: ParA family protein [Candidatus Binatia bacterium]|jgi:chromosome partitioning protein
MAHVYTLANAKGGCGKSTVALNLAICFAKNGQRTLAIDLDQQGNLSAALGADLNELKFTTHWLLINGSADISTCLVEARPRLKLLPNTIDIQADDLLEAVKVNRELLLKRKLRPVLRDFDIVLIDTPPAMRAATLNGLAVADTILIPVDSSSFALLGLTQLLQVIAAIREAHQPDLAIRPLSTMFNRRQNLDKQIRMEIERFFGPDLVLQTVIHKNVDIPQAAAIQKGVVEYSSIAQGSFDFTKLTHELVQELEDEQEAAQHAVHQSQ